MKNFAVITSNKVINVIIAETKENAELGTDSECIEYTTENPVGIGWTYDGTNFIAPILEETPSE
jgi:hypothetical protein